MQQRQSTTPKGRASPLLPTALVGEHKVTSELALISGHRLLASKYRLSDIPCMLS